MNAKSTSAAVLLALLLAACGGSPTKESTGVASQVPGVKAVRNDIRLKSTDG